MYKLIQKAVNFIISPRQVLISSFGQLYRIVEALFVIFIALFIKIVASGYAMFFLTKHHFKNDKQTLGHTSCQDDQVKYNDM